jgi:hypothetical protein
MADKKESPLSKAESLALDRMVSKHGTETMQIEVMARRAKRRPGRGRPRKYPYRDETLFNIGVNHRLTGTPRMTVITELTGAKYDSQEYDALKEASTRNDKALTDQLNEMGIRPAQAGDPSPVPETPTLDFDELMKRLPRDNY